MGKFLVIILLLFTANNAQAQVPPQGFKIQVPLSCNTTDFILKMLNDKYREVATGGGMARGSLVRLFESHNAGEKQTWTMVISIPNGTSCIIRDGDDWVNKPEVLNGDDT